MEKELKTLKDLSRMQRHNNYRIVEEETLKAEAVKWVKDMRAEALVAGYPYKELGDRDAVIKFINFFNLTEEDLK